jgi:Ni,Fe-hydrogenase III component G
MKQTLAEIFIENSDLAKKRNELKEQIALGKEKLKEIQEHYDQDPNNVDINEYNDFLKIFYKSKELKKQMTLLSKKDNNQKLYTIYSLLAYKLNKYDEIQEEIQEITKT